MLVWRRPVVLALLAALLAAAVLAVRIGGGWADSAPPRADAESADPLTLALDRALQRTAVVSPPGLALRPLAAAGADAEAVAVADGICSALADRLLRVAALRVVPCRSTSAAVATGLDDARLAQLLAVRWVLSGRAQPLADERLQLQLQLRDADGGAIAWQLDETLGAAELQALPSRVAAAATAAIGVDDRAPVEPQIAPDRYASFLRAQALARRPSIDDRRAAVRLLDELLAAEPEHTPSLFLRHSTSGWLLGNLGEPGRRQSVAELDAARAAHVEAGLALARRLSAADPLDLRGQWLLLAHDFETRRWVAGFERLDAMQLRSPRNASLLRLAARVHLHAGYVRRARELALAAARLNALDAEAIEILALAAGIERRDAELREFLAIARQLGHQGLGRAEVFDAFRRADWPEVERAHAAWVGWGGRWSADWVPAWARGLADPAAREDAARLLDGHDAATRQHFVGYFIEYALLGETERSLRSVQHHATLPPATWMQHLWWPELAAVRRDARFVPALRGLGMVAVWEQRGAPDLCTRAADGGWTCR